MKKFNISMLFAGLVFAAALSAIPSVNVYAEINSAEQRVISVASNQFYYNGKYYVATSDSISQLVAKLDKDGTDLTDEQADEAINKAYNSVGDAVAQGYMVEVGGGSSSGSSSSSSSSTTTSSSAKTAPSASVKSSSSSSKANDTTDTSAKSSSVTSSSSAAQTASSSELDKMLDDATGLTKGQRETIAEDEAKKHGTVSKNETQQQKEVRAKLLTGTSAVQDDGSTALWNDVESSDSASQIDTKVLASRPDENAAKVSAVYDSGSNTIVVKSTSGSEKTVALDDIIPFAMLKKIFLYVSWVSIVLLILSAIVLHRTKCMKYQHSTDAKGEHHVKKEIRSAFGWIITVTAAADLAVLLLTAGTYTGLLTPSGISEAVDTSGYYQYSYESMHAKVQDALLVCNIDASKLDSVITYERFLFLSKQNTLDRLNGKTAKQDYASLKTDVKNVLASDGSTAVTDTLTDNIMSIYGASLESSLVDYIINTISSGRGVLLMAFLLNLFNTALAVFLLLFSDHYIHRGMRKFAIAATAAAAVLFVLFIAAKASGFAGKTFISPEYLYIFATKMAGKLQGMLAADTAFMAVVAAAMWGVAAHCKKAARGLET